MVTYWCFLMFQFPMTMFLAAGTQSASGKQNFLIVMKMSDLQEMEEEHSNVIMSFYFEI